MNSVKWIGLILSDNKTRCIEATDISIATSHIGILSNFDAAGLSIQRMILAENQYGTELMFGREDDENKFHHTNIVFLGIARSNCSSCYSTSASCSDFTAMYIPITVIAGKSIPIDKPTPDGLASICKDASFDQKLILQNATFMNFKLNYSNDTNPYYKNCKDNYMIRMRFGEPDASSPIFATGTTLTNSDFNALFSLEEPNMNFLFWRGGCGDFNCTGEKNWLFTDVDGSLFGKPSQVIPKNKGIHAQCKDIDSWNGQLCDGVIFGILEFQNDGADQRRRIVAPVNISSKNMVNTLNEWREWKWEGPEPLDQRLARLNGLVELNSSISMIFETVVPEELKIKLLKGKGNVDYLIISIKYERPNAVEVWNLINRTLIKSFRIDQNIDLNTHNMECGANIYDASNRTITFVLTNKDDCLLKIRTIDCIKVSLRMETTVEDFFKNDGESTFIDKISAFLNLDLSRVRIVNIRSGSVIVDFVVAENKNLTNSTSAADTFAMDSKDINQTNQTLIDEYYAKKTELEQTAEKLKTGISSGQLALASKVLSISTEVVVSDLNLPINNTNNSQDNNNSNNSNNTNNNTNNETNKNDTGIYMGNGDSYLTLIVVCSISGGVVVLFLMIICCCVPNKDGFLMIKLVFDFIKGKNEKKTDVSVNQELMITSNKVMISFLI